MKYKKIRLWIFLLILFLLFVLVIIFQIKTFLMLQKQEHEDILQRVGFDLEQLRSGLRDELLSLIFYFPIDATASAEQILSNFYNGYLLYKSNFPYPDLIENIYHIVLDKNGQPAITLLDFQNGTFIPIIAPFIPLINSRFIDFLSREINITILMVDPETILIIWPYTAGRFFIFSIPLKQIEKNVLQQLARENLKSLRLFDYAIINRSGSIIFSTGDQSLNAKIYTTVDLNLFGPVLPDEPIPPGAIQIQPWSKQGPLALPNYFREMRRQRNVPAARIPQAFMLNDTGWKVQLLHKYAPWFSKVLTPSAINLFLTILILMLLSTAFLYTVSSNKKFEELQNQQKLFINSVTHELKTPLASFLGAADNLISGIVHKKDEIVTYGTLIQEEAKRLQLLIDSLLMFSGLSTKSFTIEKETLIANELINTAFFRYKDNFVNNGFFIETVMESSNVLISGNKGLLLTLFDNLFKNVLTHAVDGKFIGYGIYTTTIKSIPYCAFWIRDKGPGISKLEQKKIFSPFYRGVRATAKQLQGMGIGLYIANKIAEIHNGFIECSSARNSGTTFTIFIPQYIDKQESTV
ncbi:MAG TPA: HAMP domain-containing sensor histidine kinase [Spirochaetia bacterium]|nr:HAMP domain-containing sensor histidine kinase [Spirochaetales bacterium]HPD80699.1 HAMP domain-containing sensor histidine kinase [Spirochaetales bacterium]HRS66686.1 HAMP domain-containing sensor histidine kinase [Spirochaetia bacterium]HRV29274.1 HAMP domain-containing sensor histidine kinase [Spirochaetia bacterium]